MAPAKVGSVRFKNEELDLMPAPRGTVTGVCKASQHAGVSIRQTVQHSTI